MTLNIPKKTTRLTFYKSCFTQLRIIFDVFVNGFLFLNSYQLLKDIDGNSREGISKHLAHIFF